MRLIEKFISNFRTTILICALIIVAGLSALQELPRTEDPPMATRFAEVITFYEGADAERVESLVSEPLERAIRTLPFIKEINSVSSFGLSVIVMELQDFLTVDELDDAWSDVSDEIELLSSSFPIGVSRPKIDKERFPALTVVYGMTLEDADGNDENNLAALSRYALDLESELLKVSGTEFVETYGDPGEEILIDLDLSRLISSGLTVNDISDRIQQADTNIPAGSINGGGTRMAIEVSGRFEDLERLRRIPLRSTEDGILMLGDVATVKRAPVTPATAYALIQGQRGLAVGARMNPDRRSDLWRKSVFERINAYQSTLPSNVNIDLIYNQERYTKERLGTLVTNVLIGFGLIATVLLFSLGWRSALVVAASLPLTMLFALAAFKLSDQSIHQMSVTGLIIALGIMVDNAIVMVDTVARFKQQGLSRIESQISAVKKLWVPLMGSSMTTIFAFMPMILQSGGTGEFIGGIGYAVIFSLFGSFLISQLVVSSLAARFIDRDKTETGHWLERGIKSQRSARALQRTVSAAIKKPKRAFVMICLLPLAGFFLIGNVPTEYFPSSDRDMINLEIYLPASANAQSTRKLVERVDEYLSTDQEIESLHWFIGDNAPKVYYNLLMSADGAQNYAQAMIKMEHFKVANRKVSELQKDLDRHFPEAQFVIRRFQQGPPFAPIEVRIYGNDRDELATIGEDIKRQLLSIDSVSQVRASLSQGQPKAFIAADEAILQVIGLGLADAAMQTQSATDGLVRTRLSEDTQSLPVRVRARGYKVDGGEMLADYPLLGRGETLANGDDTALLGTPLSALAEIQFVPVRGSIARHNGERINTITAYLQDGELPSETLAEFKQVLEREDFSLPANYRLEYGGESESSGDAVGNLMGTFGLIGVMMIMSLVFAFNSFRLTVGILFVAFLAAGLGLLSLSFTNFPFGFTSILGVMAMIGLAINAAIVIIAECRSDADACHGDTQAVTRCVMHCSRHITSTTITTIMGFMPLLLAGGGFWPPFAITVAGGTLLTTMLSLALVPMLFTLFAKRRPFTPTGQPNDPVAAAVFSS